MNGVPTILGTGPSVPYIAPAVRNVVAKKMYPNLVARRVLYTACVPCAVYRVAYIVYRFNPFGIPR